MASGVSVEAWEEEGPAEKRLASRVNEGTEGPERGIEDNSGERTVGGALL